MYYENYFPWLILCARGHKPAFPARYCEIHPYGGGFQVTKKSERWRYGHWSPVFMEELVIDPEGLNPDTLPDKIVHLLKAKLNQNRRWNRDGFKSRVVFLCEPACMSWIVAELIERLGQLPARNEVRIGYWFPEMGIQGFWETFWGHLPILTPDELDAELAAAAAEITRLVEERKWKEADNATEYLSALLGYATSREPAT